MNSKQDHKHKAFPQAPPPIHLHPGQHLYGFEVKAVTPIDELQAVALELAHPHSGARLLHFYTDDPKNLFSISPITPTPDDRGGQHILEHAVMAGSRNYPVKDVWREMMKRSLATFDSTNAMNYFDHAFYYASSRVKKDLFNLTEVYFDSVFHPLLTEETFKREGHHLEPVDPNQPTGALKINGIVYNEVKNNVSEPKTRLFFATLRGLLPDTLYARDAAGNSQVMPDLTYEEFRTYHKTYYHPSNSYFFFYGNIPTREYLEFLADKLEALPKREAHLFPYPFHPELTYQPRWKFSRTVTDTYPLDAGESLDGKTYLLLSWIIGDKTDPIDFVSCQMLSRILLGNEGAPLRKAIIDSKLGAGLFDLGRMMPLGTGTMVGGPNTTFCVGLTGSEAGRVQAFTELVIDTLRQIADTEIDEERVNAAFQQITSEYQEITQRFPFRLMERIINTWMYEQDPTSFLKMGTCLSAIRRRWERHPHIFNELIRERLLDNPHRLTTVLSPDPDMKARLDANEDARLKAIRAQLTNEQMIEIARNAASLARLNGLPNSPEDLAKLPQLHVSDLPEKPQQIPTTLQTVSGCPLLRNEVFSNGVNYLVLNFDLQGLPQHLWQYLPRYTDAISKLGAGNMNYEQVAQRTAAAVGGLECSPNFRTHGLDPDHPVWNMQFKLKALDGKIEDALDVLQDLIFAVNPRDTERLRDVLNQAVTEYRINMVNKAQFSYGSTVAVYRATHGFSPQAYLSEIVFGLPQLHTSEMLLNRFDESHEELSGYIEQIRDFLLCRGRITASFTGSDAAFEALHGKFAEWIGNMRDEPITSSPTGFEPFDTYPREGLAAPMQVAYCTQVIPAPHYSYPDSVLLAIGAYILENDYLYPELRLKGNAYGGGFTYAPFDSCIYYGSYADPHVARTLDVFQRTIDSVQQVEWTQTNIDRAIIATAKDFLQTVCPSQASTDTLTHYLTGQTQEIIEERYVQLRGATPKAVKGALLQVLEENRDKASICVVASREKLESENQKMVQPLHIEDIINEPSV